MRFGNGATIALFAQLLLVAIISSVCQNGAGEIVFEDLPPEPWGGIVLIQVNITPDPGVVDDVILTIDGDVNTSRTLTDMGNGTWCTDLDTTDHSNGNHHLKITATMGDGAESVTEDCLFFNAIRIVFMDVPEEASGFLLLQAQILDDRLNTTNVWYNIDAGDGFLLPHYRDNIFRIVVGIDDYPDGLHTFTVKTINIDNVVAMKSVDVTVTNQEADIHILPQAVDEGPTTNGSTDASDDVFNLTVLAGGLPVTATNIWYGVDGDIWGRVPYKGEHIYGMTVTTSNLTTGTHRLFVTVLDEGGMALASDETMLEVENPPTEEEGFPLIVFLVSLAIVVFVTAGTYRVATRKKVFPPEDVFLIYYRNGVLIQHLGPRDEPETRTSSEGTDKDLMTSMLVAIQDFVMTSFQREGETNGSDLKQIGLGNRTILLERGSKTVLALVVPGVPKLLDLDRYGRSMVALQTRIESSYEEALEDWDGDRDQFQGVDELLIDAFNI